MSEVTPVSERFEPNPPRWLRPIRDRVVRLPGGTTVWKITVALIGAAVVAAGLLLIPLPGPGWAIVFLGLAVWGTEFRWAQRLLRQAKLILRGWTSWAGRQPLLMRLLLGIAALMVLAALAYLAWRFLL